MSAGLGLFSICVRKAIAKRLHNALIFSIQNAANRITGDDFLAFLLLFFVGTAKSSTFPEWKALNKEIEFDVGWGASHWTWVFDLAEKPLADRASGFIELLALISTELQPMPKTQANEKREQSKKLGVRTDDLLDIFKEHGLYWFGIFLAGLIFGDAFGWPPFSSKRRHKPNSVYLAC